MTNTIDHLNRFVRRSWPERTNEDRIKSQEFSWVIFSSNGGTTLNDNVLIFGFPEKQLEPALVAKVCRLPENGRILQAEYERLVEAWKFLGAEAVNRLPRPLALEKAGQEHILVTTYLSGESLLEATRSSLWNNSARLRDFGIEAAQFLKLFNQVTAVPIGSDINFKTDFNEKVHLFSNLFSLNRTEIKILEKLTTMVEQKVSEAWKQIIIHGDFWHGNMIHGTGHGKLMLVDWQYARWAVDASPDIYLFPLAAALAAAPYGPQKDRAVTAAQIFLKWQPEWISAYLKAYGRPDGYVMLPQTEGLLACCVEMAVRPTYNFNCPSSDDILWRTLFSELV